MSLVSSSRCNGHGMVSVITATATAATNKLWQPWLPAQDEAQSYLKYKGMNGRGGPTNGNMTYGVKRLVNQLSHHPEPIDMSITKRIRGSPPSYQQSVRLIQAAAVVANRRRRPQRPSVITLCAANSDITSTTPHTNNMDNSSGDNEDEDDDGGVCDSVVNEHFRRSLGSTYRYFFPSGNTANNSSTSNSALDHDTGLGLSVDDHFAKALGEDTWLRLRQQETPQRREFAASNRSGSSWPQSVTGQRSHDEEEVVTSSAARANTSKSDCCNSDEIASDKTGKLFFSHERRRVHQ